MSQFSGTPSQRKFTSPGLPAGGTDGQVLTKTSAQDYEADWEEQDALFLDGGTPTTDFSDSADYSTIDAGGA